MASRATPIGVNKSLIPFPVEAFPKNLGRTYREDSPEEMLPILAYDGANILPTSWGYRSYFAVNEKLQRLNGTRLLATSRCEYMFWYQSAQLDNVLVALTSNGIYITNTDVDVDWILAVDLSEFDLNPAVRNQWTFCTINNVTFMYLQGIGQFYGLVNAARYAEAATPSIISNASVTQVSINWNVGLLKYVPNYLNMAGQLGIFKAGNRLGFWDSDTSVAWSSANYVEDFTPSVTTLAGFAKFADVIGTITKVCQHGDGFIIYCSRSIVGVRNNSEERSKFSGQAILSNVGVLFDRQITVAQPDHLHYVLTSAGLYTISNYTVESLATDIIDGLVESNPYLALDYIDGRYLFINTINGWEGANLDYSAETAKDFDGNEFKFPPVTYPNISDGKELIESYINGSNSAVQDGFTNFTPIDPDDLEIPEGRTLVPCYDIKSFTSTWADTEYEGNPAGTEIIDSKLKLGVTYLLEDFYVMPVVTVNSVSAENIMPGDFAGDELADKLNAAVEAFNRQVEYQNAWMDDNREDVDVLVASMGEAPAGYISGIVEKPFELKLIERRILPNCVSVQDLVAEATECRIVANIKQDRIIEILSYFEGVERYSSSRSIAMYDSSRFYTDELNVDGDSLPQCSAPRFWISVPTNQFRIDQYNAARRSVGLPNTSYSNMHNGVYTPNGYMELLSDTRIIGWTYLNYPKELVFGPGVTKELIEFRFARIRLTNPADITYSVAPPLDSLDEGWYETIDGGPWYPIPDPQVSGYPGVYKEGFAEISFNWSRRDRSIDKAISQWDLVNTATADSEAWKIHRRETFNTFSSYRLEGKVKHQIDLLPNFELNVPVYDLEVSGYGYYPGNGFSFRKTHSRHSSTSCPIPQTQWFVTLPEDIKTNPSITRPDFDTPVEVTPPYKWEYPDTIPLPPNYWLTKKGSASPVYPTFNRSLIYDTQLQKWGIANMKFKAICGISPVNRTDNTIVPVHDYGMLAAVLNPDGSVSTIKPNNSQGEICYGKLGDYRLGRTRLTYLKCHFKEKFVGSIIVETSIDGRTIQRELTQAADFNGVLSAHFPFTMVGDWFNIKLRGNFTLSHIECYLDGRSRR